MIGVGLESRQDSASQAVTKFQGSTEDETCETKPIKIIIQPPLSSNPAIIKEISAWSCGKFIAKNDFYI